MKAISIRQPWAALIILGPKDIENRTWRTKHRGPLLIHASLGMTRDYYEGARSYAEQRQVAVPRFEDLQRGGIIGMVDIIDCVGYSESDWFMGPIGFVLANPKPLPFTPCRGALSLFDVPDSLLLPMGEAKS